ncbi:MULTISPECIES: hypothetical protein [Deinococcus]|uniref:Lipoprotein n=2 Tax=Deinococcus TaxID=1298 RepID=A0A221T0U3_9DEIO|nr:MULTISPECIES: hypothetical protein [Deinococcus]ASN82499.1 hypothetical protein DFI_15060 [Deinococcus ficus]MDP9765682.1 hypothetical protein [Deinococcus enclensis]
MRPPFLLPATLAILALVPACTTGRDARPAAATEEAVTAAAREAMLAAARAIGGTDLKADARWASCLGGVGYEYVGGGTMQAREGDVARQLEAVRTALVRAGFTDVTQVEGKVSVERDDVLLTLTYHRAYRGWPVSFHSKCRSYPRADRARVQSAERRDIGGLTR